MLSFFKVSISLISNGAYNKIKHFGFFNPWGLPEKQDIFL